MWRGGVGWGAGTGGVAWSHRRPTVRRAGQGGAGRRRAGVVGEGRGGAHKHPVDSGSDGRVIAWRTSRDPNLRRLTAARDTRVANATWRAS